MDSILTSVKKLSGITEEYQHFDADIIMHINATFLTLLQLGVGPAEGFAIEDETSVWTDFIPASPLLNAVKTYMYYKVRLIFDPPSSSGAVEALKQAIAEAEWRINVEAEKEENQNGV